MSDKTTWEELKNRHAAEVSFTGLGLWDVFASGGKWLGRVAFFNGAPPFLASSDPNYRYAPGYFFFPVGLVPIVKGYRADGVESNQ